jgi:hypothetical protein
MNTQSDLREPIDRSSPTLLLVSLVTVLAGVGGVIAVAVTSAGWAVFVTMAVLLAGLAIVAQTMVRQLAESGDDH